MDGDLAHVLLERTEEVIASWSHRFDRSSLRVPRPVDPRHHAAMVHTMVISLGETVRAPRAHGVSDLERRLRPGTIPPQRLQPGGADVRELEKAAALTGASFAAGGASGYDVAALLTALRDAVLEFAPSDWAQAIGDVFEWLLVIALDAFATAGSASAQERAAEQLEAGTPVVLVTPEVPAVLLVGAPTAAVLDSVLARALLLVVRVGAPSLVLDVSGLADPTSPEVLATVGRFLEQKRMGAVEVILSGAAGQAGERWGTLAQGHGVALTVVDRFDAAVARALERAGAQIVRRRT